MQQLVCSAFIEKKALGDRKIFLSFLPSKKREEFLAIQTPSINLCQKFDLTAYLLKWVHYTWLAPFLRSLGEKEIRLFLSAFDSEKGAKLKQLLLVSPPLIPLLPLTKTFLQKRLADSLLIDTPTSSLRPLSPPLL